MSDDGNSVACIIDWEAAAYFPLFWLATKPACSWAFRLGSTAAATNNEWAKLLVHTLEMRGLNNVKAVYMKWFKAELKIG